MGEGGGDGAWLWCPFGVLGIGGGEYGGVYGGVYGGGV
jgi:hypothetical protein